MLRLTQFFRRSPLSQVSYPSLSSKQLREVPRRKRATVGATWSNPLISSTSSRRELYKLFYLGPWTVRHSRVSHIRSVICTWGQLNPRNNVRCFAQYKNFGICSLMKIPNQSTHKSYLRGLKRQRCKARNMFHHLDQKPDVVGFFLYLVKLKERPQP